MQDEIVEEKTPIYSSSLLEESVSKHADITSDLSEDSLVDSGQPSVLVDALGDDFFSENMGSSLSNSESLPNSEGEAQEAPIVVESALTDMIGSEQEELHEEVAHEAPKEEAFEDELQLGALLADEVETEHQIRTPSGDEGLIKTPVLRDHLGRHTSLVTLPFLIGRGTDCDLQLDTEGVSREHAEIFKELDRLIIRDLGSINGTHVNGYQVERVMIEPGDEIRLGDARLIFDFVEDEFKELQQLEEIVPLLDDSAEPDELLVEPNRWFVWLFAFIPLLVILVSAYLIFDVDEVEPPSAGTNQHESNSSVMDSNSPVLKKLESKPKRLDSGPQADSSISAPVSSSLPVVKEARELATDEAEARLQKDLEAVIESLTEQKPDEGEVKTKDESPISTQAPREPQSNEPVVSSQPIVSSAVRSDDKTQHSKIKVIQPSQMTSGSAASLKSQTSELLSRVEKDFNEGRIKQWLKQVGGLLDNPALGVQQQRALQAKRSEINTRLFTFYSGLQSYHADDKVVAYDNWVKFLKAENNSGRKNKSYYYSFAAKKLEAVFFERSRSAQDRGDLRSAYRFMVSAARFTGSEEAQKKVDKINQRAKSVFNEGLAYANQGNIKDAQLLWREIIQILPKDHEMHTKAAAKLAWSYAHQ